MKNSIRSITETVQLTGIMQKETVVLYYTTAIGVLDVNGINDISVFGQLWMF